MLQPILITDMSLPLAPSCLASDSSAAVTPPPPPLADPSLFFRLLIGTKQQYLSLRPRIASAEECMSLSPDCALAAIGSFLSECHVRGDASAADGVKALKLKSGSDGDEFDTESINIYARVSLPFHTRRHVPSLWSLVLRSCLYLAHCSADCAAHAQTSQFKDALQHVDEEWAITLASNTNAPLPPLPTVAPPPSRGLNFDSEKSLDKCAGRGLAFPSHSSALISFGPVNIFTDAVLHLDCKDLVLAHVSFRQASCSAAVTRHLRKTHKISGKPVQTMRGRLDYCPLTRKMTRGTRCVTLRHALNCASLDDLIVTLHATFVNRYTSLVTRHTSHVRRVTSFVTSHASHITRPMAHVTCHKSHELCHSSHIAYHTSHVARHTSHATRHTSHIRPSHARIQTSEAGRAPQ